MLLYENVVGKVFRMNITHYIIMSIITIYLSLSMHLLEICQ